MTNKIFLFFLLLLSLKLSGQENQWYFSLNMGKSIPLGAFSQNSLDQLNTGFASNGFMLSLESNYSFNGRFSLKGMALLNTNTVNRLPLFTNLNDHLKKTISIDITDQKFLSLTENPWVTNGLLVGPAYTITFNKLKWDLYGTGGFISYLSACTSIYLSESLQQLGLH